MRGEGVGRLEVGGRYVGPLSPDGSGDWYPMHSAETMKWSDGRSTLGPTSARGMERRSEAVKVMVGLDAGQMATILDRQRPDPLAAKDRSLSPRERFALVSGQGEFGD